MARLLAVPIRDRGDSVLIVSNCSGVVLLGFVPETALQPFFETTPSTDECLDFVDRHLAWFEQVLEQKSRDGHFCDEQIVCVEIVPADLTDINVAKHRWN